MFAELREAYATLSNPAKRASYDMARKRQGWESRPRHSSAGSSPPPGAPRAQSPAIDPSLTAERVYEASVLSTEALRILGRKSKSGDLLIRVNDSVLPHVVLAAIGIFVLLTIWMSNYDTQIESRVYVFMAFLIGALLVGHNVLRIWLFLRTPLGKAHVVTPYYFGELRWDRCRLTPLLALKDVRLTNHFTNGVYSKTSLVTEWLETTISFDVKHKANAQRLGQFLIDNANRTKAAFSGGRGRETINRFAFASTAKPLPTKDLTSKRIKKLERMAWGGSLLVAAIMALGIPSAMRSVTPSVAVDSTTLSLAGTKPVAESNALAAGSEPFPENGHRVDYGSRENVAPLRIDATGKSSNFLIRLRDATTHELVTDIFVRAGNVTERDVPLGEFKLLIAAGDVWYGNVNLFGDDGSYSEAIETAQFSIEGDRVRGHRLILQEAVGGNLRKSPVDRTRF